MSEIRNRELSQFSSFLHVDNINQNIGIASDATPYIGIGTAEPQAKLHVVGNVRVSGILSSTSFAVGVGTITYLDGTFFNTGIATFNSLVSAGASIGIGSITRLRSLSGIVTNLSGTGVTYTSAHFGTLHASQGYIGAGLVTSITGQFLNYTGVSTFGNGSSGVVISSGIITATNPLSPVVYYGDGQYLTGTIAGVGINSNNAPIGYGATVLNFTGAGIGTISVTAGIATIPVIAPPINSLDTQVLYNNAGSISGSANFTFNNSTGTVSATNFNTTSDSNLKENVTTFENALDIVSQLRGVRFDWKETHAPSVGVIAQELEEVLPELVTQTDPKTVNYNGIIGVLIEAIKELQAEIQVLKNTK